MFLTKEKFDFNEGPYKNVLEPEKSYSSSESQVDNNEKPGKSKKGKRKAPNKRAGSRKSTMKSSKKPALKKAKTNEIQRTNEENMIIFASFSPISVGQLLEKPLFPEEEMILNQ